MAMAMAGMAAHSKTAAMASLTNVKIGEQTWMAENLNYGAKDINKCGGTALQFGEGEGEEWYLLENKNTANCDNYGRLYNWEMAMKACPSGWHLPTNEEWDKLYRFADGTSNTDSPYGSETADKFLKATSGWNNDGNGEDKYGFAALPGGVGWSNGHFVSVGYGGNWWSSTEWGGNASYRYMDWGKGARWGDLPRSEFLSVRCLQD